jgi:hypothetical protein
MASAELANPNEIRVVGFIHSQISGDLECLEKTYYSRRARTSFGVRAPASMETSSVEISPIETSCQPS